MIIINTNVVALIIYFICQLNTNTASRFFIFYGYCYLLMWSCTGLGFLIGAIVPDKNVGLSLMTIIFVSAMLVSGFFVSQDNMIPVMYPLKYISPYKWSFQALVLNEYRDLTLSCSPTWNPVQSLGFKETMELSIWVTAILGVSFHVMAYFALLAVTYFSKR